MNPNEYLGRTIDCSCGLRHAVPVRHLVYAANAVDAMAGVLGREIAGRSAHVICDRRTRGIAGDAALHMLEQAGWSAGMTGIEDPASGSPVCSDSSFATLDAHVPRADVYIAAGSGVVNDLAKWLAFARNTPYAALATAASMSGYTAANVAPTVKGVKLLVRAAPPLGLFADPAVIEAAPIEMTVSGFGDVIAKPMSTADWLMNHRLLGEPYCPVCAGLITALEPLYLERPEAVAACEPSSIRALFHALAYSGVAMTMMGSSIPASGGEHLFSHTLDMMTGNDGVPHDLHGRQVGLGTIFSAALYERLLSLGAFEVRPMPEGIDRAFWGPIADAIAAEYAAKQEAIRRLADALRDRTRWHAACSAVAPGLRPARAIADSLRRAGAACSLGDIGCSRARARAALLHMHEIRARSTVVDVAWLTGIMPGAVDDILNQWPG